MGFLYIIISGLCSALAGAALKLGAGKKEHDGLLTYLPHLSAVGLYFIGFVFYFFALSKLNLTVAYPVMVSSAIIFVMFIGSIMFSESITVSKIFGTLLIIAGVYFVNAKG